jgi:hypothetical protein
MKTLFVPFLTAAFVLCGSLTCLAQEKLPGELPPPKTTPPVEGTPVLTDCNHSHPALKILEVEQVKPVQIIEPREVITLVTRPVLEIAYKIEKREIIDLVMEKREVTCLVPCTTLVPCQEIDPHTGCATTVMKEVTEMKPQKEFVFTSVPVKRILEIKCPYLREGKEIIPQRNILLEQRTVLQTEIAVVPAPTQVYPERYLMTPPTCPAPGCQK